MESTQDGLKAHFFLLKYMIITERIEHLITPNLDALGYGIICIQLLGSKRQVLRIMIENKDMSPISIDDCVRVSREVSALLDVEDPIQSAYNLEVSSAGLDRPLIKIEDFERFAGNAIKLETHTLVQGRKRFKGILDRVDGSVIHLTMEDQQFQIPHEEIRISKLDPDLEFAQKKGSKQKSKAKT